ncbi:alpha/beta hydrolase [Eisenbergiella sp.]
MIKIINEATQALDRYTMPCSQSGRIECVRYPSRAYALEAIYGRECIPLEKTMYVYLPYGYDPGGKYPVLYLMHGGTDDEGYWFGKGRYDGTDKEKYTDAGNVTQNLADHLIQEKTIEPIIIVTPSFCENVEEYQNRKEYPAVYFETVNYFWMEMKNDIMPYIQKHYATYAVDATEEAFAKARQYTAFAGASQGSVTGLYSIMLHMLDVIGYIGSFSAGAIKFQLEGTELKVELDEAKLEELVKAVKCGPRPCYWYNGCGDHDMMYSTHRATYDMLENRCEKELQEGTENCCFVLHKDGEHSYRFWIRDFYNILSLFFSGNEEEHSI